MSYIRKVTRHCGRYGISSDYIQVAYFPYSEEKIQIGEWQRKYEETPKKQKVLNNKKAKRYLEALIYANFGEGDLRVDLTYSQENMPEDEKAAKREVQNYIKRIKYWRKKKGLPNIKYIIITEVGKSGNIHHHILMDAAMDRDFVEDLWKKGLARTRRLQPETKTKLMNIVRYLTKDFKPQKKSTGKRRWDSSKNLVKPWNTINDNPRMMSRKKIRLMRELPTDSDYMRQLIEGDNPGYRLMDVEKEEGGEAGTWHFFCRMYRKAAELSTKAEVIHRNTIPKREQSTGEEGKTHAEGTKKAGQKAGGIAHRKPQPPEKGAAESYSRIRERGDVGARDDGADQ